MKQIPLNRYRGVKPLREHIVVDGCADCPFCSAGLDADVCWVTGRVILHGAVPFPAVCPIVKYDIVIRATRNRGQPFSKESEANTTEKLSFSEVARKYRGVEENKKGAKNETR